MWISPGDHKLVGTFLAEVRKERGISQVELAHRLGKPQSFVSSYERGQRRVDFLEYAQIANALGIDARAVGGALVNEAVAYIEAQLKAIR